MSILAQLPYLPEDRFRAIIQGEILPPVSPGSVLFADISGFTSLTERLKQILGARQGAEILTVHLNQFYNRLIDTIHRYSGTVVTFSGDAITCWFPGQAAETALRATVCAFALQQTLQLMAEITLPDNETLSLGLKTAVATGTVRRYVVGDPEIQLIDILAGNTVTRTATGERLIRRGEVVVDEHTASLLSEDIVVQAWRQAEVTGERYAVVASVHKMIETNPAPAKTIDTHDLHTEQFRSWLLPDVFAHLEAGSGDYLTELRPAVALFVNFSGIDYEVDSSAGEKLDRFVRHVQHIVTGYGGNVLQLTIGDKGSYLYAAFGAPAAHEDDAERSLNAALELRNTFATQDIIQTLRIGISQGLMRTGAYGSETRRTFGVLGDEVNFAAALMQAAAPNSILISASMQHTLSSQFEIEAVPLLKIKGKQQPVQAYRLVERKDDTFARQFYTIPLVGRDDVLAAMSGYLQPIFEARHAGVIMIYGDPGMGKSRLVYEIQQRMNAVTWFTGQADNLQRVPFHVFAYFLRPYFNQQRRGSPTANLEQFNIKLDALISNVEDPLLRGDLQRYRTFLAGLIGLTIPGSLYQQADGRLLQENTIAAIKALVRAEARKQPVILHIEDAQWLDESSISQIRHLTYNMESVPLVLVITSRYGDDGTLINVGNLGDVPHHNIILNQLPASGTRTLIEHVLNSAVSDDLANLIRAKAEGNPFFTEQLTLDLRERNLLIQTESQIDLVPNAVAEVPAEVNAVLIARLDRLTAQVKAVVQTASVLGREFEVMVLSQMLRDDVLPAIARAEKEAIWSALTKLRYIFRHALLRDAAYQMQVQERRKELHRIAAGVIEAVYPDDKSYDSALVEHWEAAGDTERSLFYIERLAGVLVGITADFDYAERLIERGLSYGESPYRTNLYLTRGSMRQNQGDFSGALEDYTAGLALAGDNIEKQANALISLSSIHWSKSDYAAATRYATQALELATQTNNRAAMAQSYLNLANAAVETAQYMQAEDYLQLSLRLYRELNHPDLAKCLSNLGSLAMDRGDTATAERYFGECLELRRAQGNRISIANALNNLGVAAFFETRYEEARHYYEEAAYNLREIGATYNLSYALNNLGNVLYALGDYPGARKHLEEGLQIRRKVDNRKAIATSLNNLGNLAVAEGNYQSARNFYEESLDVRQAIDDLHGMQYSFVNSGNLAMCLGNYAVASELFEKCLAGSLAIDFPPLIVEALANLTILKARTENPDAARSMLRQAITSLSRLPSKRPSQETFVLLAAAYVAYIDRRLESAVQLVGLVLARSNLERNYFHVLDALSQHLQQVVNTAQYARLIEEGKLLKVENMFSQWLAE